MQNRLEANVRVIEIAARLALGNGELIVKEMAGRYGPLGCGRSSITKWSSFLSETMPVLFHISREIPLSVYHEGHIHHGQIVVWHIVINPDPVDRSLLKSQLWTWSSPINQHCRLGRETRLSELPLGLQYRIWNKGSIVRVEGRFGHAQGPQEEKGNLLGEQHLEVGSR